MARVFAIGVLLVLGSLAVATAWLPEGTRNVAPASKFVAGPTAAEWYEQDEPDVVKLRSYRYCGDMGYASVVHFSCDYSNDKDKGIFTPVGNAEVGSCVFGSTIDWYEIVPGVGADAFTATCYLSNTGSCGHDECSNVQLYITGTAFLFANSYALTNPKPSDGYPVDPDCRYLNDKKAVGDNDSRKKSKRHHQLRQDTEKKPSTPIEAHVMYNKETHQAPATLPATVWAGWSYLYSGYMTVVKNKRAVGEGSFEMVWPVDPYTFFAAPYWKEVSSSTLPLDALFVKNPYTATLEFFDSKHKEYDHRSN